MGIGKRLSERKKRKGIEVGPELEVGQGREAGLEAGQVVEVPHHLGGTEIGVEEEGAGREKTGEEAETEEEQETRVGVEVEAEAEAEAEKEQELKTEAGHVTGEGGTGA